MARTSKIDDRGEQGPYLEPQRERERVRVEGKQREERGRKREL